MAIVNGRHPKAITLGICERKIGTYFPPRQTVDDHGYSLHVRRFDAGEVAACARAASARAGAAFDRREEFFAAGDCGLDRSVHEKTILDGNREDVENSGLEGAMRDRLLLTSARSRTWRGACEKWRPCPIPLARPWQSGRSRTACGFAKCACRLACGNYLRISSECDGRYGGAGAEDGERHRPAWREGSAHRISVWSRS